MRRRGRLPATEVALLALLTAFVAVVALWPLTRLLGQALLTEGAVAQAFGSTGARRAIRHSLETATASALGAVLLGGLFAILVALTDLKAKRLLVFLFMLPTMIPPQVTALAWIQLTGPSSPVLTFVGLAPPQGTPNPIYGREGIILLMSIQHAPLAFLVLRAGLRHLPRETVEAARISGAGAGRIARQIVLPLIAPSLVAATGLAFVSALGNFGIPAMLGLPARYQTIPTLIFQRLSSFGPDMLPTVAALSLSILLIAGAALMGQAVAARRLSFGQVSRPAAALALPLGRWRGMAQAAVWLVLMAILLMPLSALIAASLVPAYGVPLTLSTFTLEAYVEVLMRQGATTRAFVNSTILAGSAAVMLALLAIPLAWLAVWRRRRMAHALVNLAELPYALPGIVLSIATILVFLRPLPVLGVSIYATLWIILIAYLARFFALALGPVTAAFRQADPALEEAARVSGAGPIRRILTIVAPLMTPAAAAGAILVFLTAFNELTVSALLWSGGTETVGVVIFNLEDGGSTALASAMATVTVAVVLTLMLLLQTLSPRLPRGVVPWAGN